MRKSIAGLFLVLALAGVAFSLTTLFHAPPSGGNPFSEYFIPLFSAVLATMGIAGLAVPDDIAIRTVKSVLYIGGVIPLSPIHHPYMRRLAMGSIALIWNLIGWTFGLHFFAHGQSTVAGSILMIAFLLVGLILLVQAIYYLRIDSRVRETRLTIDTHPLLLGQPVEIGLEQIYRRNLKVRELRIGLVCLHGEVQSIDKMAGMLLLKADIVAQQWRDIVIKSEDVRANQRVSLATKLNVPRDGRRSTIVRKNDKEWYAWQLRLHMGFHDGPDCRYQYPVLVENYRAEKKKEV